MSRADIRTRQEAIPGAFPDDRSVRRLNVGTIFQDEVPTCQRRLPAEAIVASVLKHARLVTISLVRVTLDIERL